MLFNFFDHFMAERILQGVVHLIEFERTFASHINFGVITSLDIAVLFLSHNCARLSQSVGVISPRLGDILLIFEQFLLFFNTFQLFCQLSGC